MFGKVLAGAKVGLLGTTCAKKRGPHRSPTRKPATETAARSRRVPREGQSLLREVKTRPFTFLVTCYRSRIIPRGGALQMDETAIAAALGMLQGVGSLSVVFGALLVLLNQEISEFKPRIIAILQQAKHPDPRG